MLLAVAGHICCWLCLTWWLVCISAAPVVEYRIIKVMYWRLIIIGPWHAFHAYYFPTCSWYLLNNSNSCFLFPFLLSLTVPHSFVSLEQRLDMVEMFVISSREARAGSWVGQTTSAHCQITLSIRHLSFTPFLLPSSFPSILICSPQRSHIQSCRGSGLSGAAATSSFSAFKEPRHT